jgi:hypothetical protein
MINIFFLNKNNQTIQGTKKIFKENKLSKNTIFQNSEGQLSLDTIEYAPSYNATMSGLLYLLHSYIFYGRRFNLFSNPIILNNLSIKGYLILRIL